MLSFKSVKDYDFQSKEEFDSLYTIGKLISKNSSSEQRLCHRKAATGGAEAKALMVKIWYKSRVDRGDYRGMRAELDALNSIKHENVVRLLGYFQCPQRFYLVMDHFEHGSLLDELISQGVKKEFETRSLIFELLAALKECHRQGLMHRNLNPMNLLIDKVSDEKGEEKLKVVLSDFAESTFFKRRQWLSEPVGKAQYQAPEVASGAYNERCDLWSVGVITFQLLSGELPFGMGTKKSEEDVVALVSRRPTPKFEHAFWKDVSSECKAFIEHCLDPSALSRVTADDALKSAWFKKKPPSGWRTSRKKKAALEAKRQQAAENLKTFNAKVRLRDAAQAYKASLGMSKQKTAKYEKIFRAMDADNSGTLTRQEMIGGKDKFLIDEEADIMTDADIDQFIDFADVNGDGVISMDEFISGATRYEETAAEEQLHGAFSMFDDNNDGYIAANEMLDVLSYLPGFSLD